VTTESISELVRKIIVSAETKLLFIGFAF